MTNEERDVIDRESEKIISICTQFICELKMEHNTKNLTKQQRAHSDVVFGLLADYLKAVYNIFNDQKNYRIRRDLETYKFLKLDSEKRHDKFEVNEVQFRKDMNLDEKIDDDTKPLLEDEKEERPVKRKQPATPKKSLDVDMNTSIQSMEDDANTSRQQQNEENGLSAEDLQMLEIENKQMLSEFKGLSEEVQQIEKHVYDIAKLQELFTEKVRGKIGKILRKIQRKFQISGRTAKRRHRADLQHRCQCH
jgi:syntaxin 18